MNKTPTNAQLRQFISNYFNVPDLETFCFDYFPELVDEFAPETPKSTRVTMLIGYCQRRSLMSNLLGNLEKERPKPYRQTFSTASIAPAVAPQPAKRNPRQIFIGHAHQDAALAQRLAADLEAEGYPVWIAPDSILPGEKWAAAVSRGLDESGVFLLLLTPEAVESRWVRSETNVAVELEHEGAMRLIPLQVKPCRLPALWRTYQRIAWRREYEAEWAQLVEAIENKDERLKIGVTDVGGGESGLKSALQTGRQRERFVHEKTGLEFVRILAGDFLYGLEKEQTIYLPEYWMSKTPVTQEVYQRFINANPAYDVPFYDANWAKPYNWDRKKRTFPTGKANHPVVWVSWYDALAFVEWAGVSLPTEAEWEKAARGTDGRVYPWGSKWATNRANTKDAKVDGTTPVGKYPGGRSPYGLLDMSGNVWEWCSTRWWDENEKEYGDFYAPDDGREDLSGGDVVVRVLRGGSWYHDMDLARCGFRFRGNPWTGFNSGGIRCCCATFSLSGSEF